MDQLTNKINDLQESVEFTEKRFEEKLVEIENKSISKTKKLEEELGAVGKRCSLFLIRPLRFEPPPP